jgi:hypothetical protein
MRKCLWIAGLAAIPWLAWAQSGIDGVWKTDPRSVTAESKPSRYVVTPNEYRCESCAPKIKIKPDGTQQPLSGNPYLDSVAARIVDDHVVEVTAVKDGKPLSNGRMTISADGKSMTREVTVHEANGTVSQSTERLVRVGAVPRGVHPASGTWKFTGLDRMTDETLTFKMASGTLIMNASDGSSYDAPMDGTKVPFRNSPGIDAVSVKMSRGGTTWEEISWRGDQPLWVNTMVLSRDESTLRINWEDKLRGVKGSYTMVKQ